MAQFDVYRNRAGAGFLLEVQSDFLDGLESRVVVPLISVEQFAKPIRHLNPVFEIDGKVFVMVTQFLGAIPASELTDFKQNVAERRYEIIRAVDMLLSGV